jgi:hypothetical protein
MGNNLAIYSSVLVPLATMLKILSKYIATRSQDGMVEIVVVALVVVVVEISVTVVQLHDTILYN